MLAVVALWMAAFGVVRGDHTPTNFLRTSAGPVPTRFVPFPLPPRQQDPVAFEESGIAEIPPGLDVQQEKSFNEFCIELMRNMTLEAQGSSRGTGGGDTTVARTVGDDGTIISVENNPQGTVSNNVEVSPVIFNIADVNLVVMEKGMALFLPFDQIPLQEMLNGADKEKGGLQLMLQPEKMPPGLTECMAPEPNSTRVEEMHAP
ncbi:hypothetical protein BSKO_10539 [Bryopsis sp. KO-2023]|nr:hypothetical protein BSKO_10539 [Bryopsis sp. KO-2023]